MRSWFSRTSACVFRSNSSLYAAQRARIPSAPLIKSKPQAKRHQTVMSLSTSAVSDIVKAARDLFSNPNRNHARELTSDDVQGVLESLKRITVENVGLAKQAEEVSLLPLPCKQRGPCRVGSSHVLTFLLFVFFFFRSFFFRSGWVSRSGKSPPPSSRASFLFSTRIMLGTHVLKYFCSLRVSLLSLSRYPSASIPVLLCSVLSVQLRVFILIVRRVIDLTWRNRRLLLLFHAACFFFASLCLILIQKDLRSLISIFMSALTSQWGSFVYLRTRICPCTTILR